MQGISPEMEIRMAKSADTLKQLWGFSFLGLPIYEDYQDVLFCKAFYS